MTQPPMLAEDDHVDAAPRSGPRPARFLPGLSHRASVALDIAIAVALAIVAFIIRRGGLPVDGVWFDDSWVAVGARHGHPAGLLVYGSSHPGFTALLMVIDRAGGGLWAMAVPSLVAGAAGPAVIYGTLRSLRIHRAAALLTAAPLVVATVPVLYAGRIKGYTLDVVLVAALVFVVSRLAGRRWTWSTVVAWLAIALLAGTNSGYVLVASACAAIVLTLHAREDRVQRIVALGVQGAIQATYAWIVRSNTDLAGVEEVMETAFDGHIDFYLNPLDMAAETLKHLRRVAEVYPGGDKGWLGVLAICALLGLIRGALGRRDQPLTAPAQFMLLIVAVAFVGAVLDQFPFGTNNDFNPLTLTAGGRHTLWLVPAMAVGLGVVAQHVVLLARHHRPAVAGMYALAVVASLTIVTRGFDTRFPYPVSGSERGTAYVDRMVGPDDVVIITGTATYAHAASSDVPLRLVDTPHLQVGYSPEYLDPRYHVIGGWSPEAPTPNQVHAATADTNRVWVQTEGFIGLHGLRFVTDALQADGFTRTDSKKFKTSVIELWER